MKVLNREALSAPICEINAIIDYLGIMLDHAGKLIGMFMNFDVDAADNASSDTALNFEALDELVFAVKKISSKADMLQNKVTSLKSAVK